MSAGPVPMPAARAPGVPGPGWGRWTRLLTEAARPGAVRRSPAAAWLAVGTVCVGAFLGQLDASIVTVALPAIGADLGGSLGAVEWVSLSYLLALVLALAPLGRLADSLGRKSLYVYGFAVFGAASAACVLAPNLLLLDLARIVQGLGAALLQANSVALIATSIGAGRLGRALGTQGAAQALGLALGPSIGGLLLAMGDWRLLFAVNVPVALLGVVAGVILLPRSRDLRGRQPADWPGLSLFVPAVALILLSLSLAAHDRLPLWSVLALVPGVGGAVLFWRRERRTGDPVIDPDLLARPGVGTGMLGAASAASVLFGVLFVVPFFLRSAIGAGSVHSGLIVTVLPVTIAAGALVGGGVGDRVGLGPLVRIGAVVVVCGLVVLAVAALRDALLVPFALAVIGAGLGLFTPANNALVMRRAPRGRSGAVAGLLNTARAIGTAGGVAVAAALFARLGGGSQATAVVAVVLAAAAAAMVLGARHR